jgi:hypothetical protein
MTTQSTTAKTISQQIDEAEARKLAELWGGQFPSWEDFKQANTKGRVRVNKGLANKLIFSKGIPTAHKIMFGIVTLWAAFLIPPVALLLYFFMGISAWWIVGSVAVAWYLFKVARNGQCDGLRYGAAESEQFYEAVVRNGAFMFEPPAIPPRVPVAARR